MKRDEALGEISARIDSCATIVAQILVGQLEPSTQTMAGVLGMLEQCRRCVEVLK